jgi:hypothetical protein
MAENAPFLARREADSHLWSGGFGGENWGKGRGVGGKNEVRSQKTEGGRRMAGIGGGRKALEIGKNGEKGTKVVQNSQKLEQKCGFWRSFLDFRLDR